MKEKRYKYFNEKAQYFEQKCINFLGWAGSGDFTDEIKRVARLGYSTYGEKDMERLGKRIADDYVSYVREKHDTEGVANLLDCPAQVFSAIAEQAIQDTASNLCEYLGL